MKYVGTYSDPKDIVTKDKLEAVASRVSTNEDNIAMAESDIDGLQNDVGTLKTNVGNIQTALTSKQDTVVGGASTITEDNLTPSRALISNSSGKVAVSTVTSTELGYLDGVTSNVQTQLDGKQGNNDEIQGLRLTGGISSIGSMTQSVAINPAINGAGFAYKAGAIVKIYYDSYEMPIGDYDINSLFDGRFGTYINFPRPNGNFAWENSKTYPVGAYVTNDGYWYKALKENLNVTPTGDTTGAWELASNSKNGNYINLDNVLISIDITFPFSIRYENSLSLYWRANFQNASYIKVEKYDSNLEWFQVYEKSSIDGGNIINNIWLSNDPSGAGTQKRMRITLKVQTGTTWCALTQIALTGIVGGIEGTLVNRGGSTMYGDLSPYANGGASLGTSSAPWNNVRAHKFYGDGSNLTNIHYPVTSVNTKTGAVVLGASDVGALPADTVIPTVNNATLTIKRNNIDVGSFTANSANDANIDINVPTDKSDIGLGNVDNVKQYSATNPPPYPVTSVNGHTGAVTVHEVPSVTTADNGKFLRVVNGAWAAVAIANANGGSF